MLIVSAINRTGTKPDGTSDYDVEARVNERVIAKLFIFGHVRNSGAAQLLRRIADEWDQQENRCTCVAYYAGDSFATDTSSCPIHRGALEESPNDKND